VDPDLVIESASDAFSAGRLVASFRPSLLFLDQRLPGVDALELCSRLARDPETSTMTIAVLLAQPSPDAERAFRSRGATACLSRPPAHFSVEKLVRVAFQMPEAGALGSSPPSILIVDPLQHGRGVRDELEGALPGARIAFSDSCVDALLAIAVERPDLLVIDVSALELDGPNVIRKIQERLPDDEMSIIAVGDGDNGIGARALDAGATCFILKPLSAADVLAQLGQAPRRLRRKKQR
jgi:CheY-like chemotaxis protein